MGAVAIGALADHHIGLREPLYIEAFDGALIGHRDITGMQERAFRCLEEEHGRAQDVSRRQEADGEARNRWERRKRLLDVHGGDAAQEGIDLGSIVEWGLALRTQLLLFHDAHRVPQQDVGEHAGAVGGVDRQVREPGGDEWECPGVVDMGMCDEQGFWRCAIQQGEIGEARLSRFGGGAHATIDEQAMSCDMEQGTGGSHLRGTSEKCQFHVPLLCYWPSEAAWAGRVCRCACWSFLVVVLVAKTAMLPVWASSWGKPSTIRVSSGSFIASATRLHCFSGSASSF